MAQGIATFLPAARLPAAVAPEPGTPAPALPDDAARASAPRIVAFLRHAGCPFAEATLRALRAQAEHNPQIEWIAVTHVPAQASAVWQARAGGAGAVRIVDDPHRRLYAAWGLDRTSLGHFLGPRSLAAVARQARSGVRNTAATGTRWQRAGTFAVDANGIVRWRHLPAHAGDLPRLDAAIAAVAAVAAYAAVAATGAPGGPG